MVKISLNI